MKKYNISTNFFRVIKNLYDKATSAVLFVSSIGDWFQRIVGVRLRRLLFNIFLERIMTNALEDHEGIVSIGGRAMTDLRFADAIDGLAGEEDELAKLVELLNKASTAYGIEISAETTKLMTNNTSGINIIIITNPLTARAVGAPQMILQPVFSIFSCSSLPSGTCRTPACPFPDVVFPPPPPSALFSFPFHCALQDGYGQT